MLKYYRQHIDSPYCVLFCILPTCPLDSLWNTLLSFHLSPLSLSSTSKGVQLFKQAWVCPIFLGSCLCLLFTPNLLPVESVFDIISRRGKVKNSVYRKIPSDGENEQLRLYCYAKWMVCSCSASQGIFQVYVSMKKHKLPIKCPKILYLLP